MIRTPLLKAGHAFLIGLLTPCCLFLAIGLYDATHDLYGGPQKATCRTGDLTPWRARRRAYFVSTPVGRSPAEPRNTPQVLRPAPLASNLTFRVVVRGCCCFLLFFVVCWFVGCSFCPLLPSSCFLLLPPFLFSLLPWPSGNAW